LRYQEEPPFLWKIAESCAPACPKYSRIGLLRDSNTGLAFRLAAIPPFTERLPLRLLRVLEFFERTLNRLALLPALLANRPRKTLKRY